MCFKLMGQVKEEERKFKHERTIQVVKATRMVLKVLQSMGSDNRINPLCSKFMHKGMVEAN